MTRDKAPTERLDVVPASRQLVTIAVTVAVVSCVTGACDKPSRIKPSRADTTSPQPRRVDALPKPATDAAPVRADALSAPTECAGPRIVLSRAFASKNCELDGEPDGYRIPPGLQVSVVGPAEAKAGASIIVQVVLRNTSRANATLVFGWPAQTPLGKSLAELSPVSPADAATQVTDGFHHITLTKDGEHVFKMSLLAVSPYGGGRTYSRVTMTPGGTAVAKVKWWATVPMTDVRSKSTPLPPGPYEARILIPWPGASEETEGKQGWFVSHAVTVSE